MSKRRRIPWLPYAFGIVAGLVSASVLHAEPAFTRAFDGPDTVWQVVKDGVRSEVVTHDCQPVGARDNGGFERIVVAAAAGESVQFECPTPPIAVLDELQVRLWVKSSRPDIQLAARIRLPRSVDLKRDAMARAVVKGTAYNRPGQWQELVVANAPKLLAERARIMRTAPGAAIDVREAYMDAVVLLVPGDPKGVEVSTDRCEVEGIILARSKEPSSSGGERDSAAPASQTATSRSATSIAQTGYDEAALNTDPNAMVRLHGATLMVGGKPFLTRAIEWNDEPLKFLAERGFNAVRLKAPPNPQQIADANRHDLWFICTPPRPEAILRDGLGEAGDRVLGWYLDDEALVTDPNYGLRWTDVVRERDAVYGRPILVATTVAGNAAHDAADVLVARDPRNSLFTRPEFAESLRNSSGLGRPGAPLWASVNTQYGDAVRNQINLLSRMEGSAPQVAYDHLASLLHVAGTSGIRGIVFQSQSSLSGSDPASQTRAAALELLNRRLQLMEAWLASGKIVSSVTSTNGSLTAAVMYVDRARLLVPVSEQPPASTAAAGKTPVTNELAFLVPGISESSRVHFLTPVSLRTLSSERIAGGTKFSIPSADGLVVITEDPKVVQSLRQHIMRHGVQTLKLERELAVEQTKAAFRTDHKLAQLGYRSILSANYSTEVNTRIAQLDAAMKSGQFEQAQTLVRATIAETDRIAANQRRAILPPDRLQSNALLVTSDRLADFAAFERSLKSLQSGANLLAGGDFEDLGEMTQAGWQHIVHSRAGATTHAELSADRPHSGTYSLELKAAPDSGTQHLMRTDPFVWIVSPPMPLEESTIVEITGWVRVDHAFGKPGSGLVIMDTIGGPELSIVVGETSGWQSFRMIRAVPKAMELRLTFALTGVGSANVDGVMVRTLEEPVTRRLPEIPGQDAAATPGPAEVPASVTQLPMTR